MRLIDAEDIPYTMLYKENWMNGTGEEAQGAWKSDIDKMPTIDAVQVVRCRDCKYSYAEELNISSQQGHMEKRYIRFCKCDSPILVVADMHFCSCGEREDDADN